MEVERYIKYLKPGFDFYLKLTGKKVPYPKVVLHTSLQKCDPILIKTGYFDPNTDKIHLFLCDDIGYRAVKDVLRSFFHECTHLFQQVDGVIANSGYSSDKITEDKKLVKLEAEAYLKGNFALREWTETLQKEGKKV